MKLSTLSSFLVNKKKGHYLLIGLFSLAAHGLLLLNDGVYWDGWLIYVSELQDRWSLTYGIYADRGGLPVYTAFHWLMRFFPDFVFGYKLVAYLFILGSAFLVYRIADSLIESPKIALFIALIALTYPANQATVELIVIPYLLSYLLFWLGCFLFVQAKATGDRKLWLHLGSIVSLLLSFRMYSLLPFFYGFLLIVFVNEYAKARNQNLPSVVQKVFKEYWIYALLPILFWFGNALIFPPTGPYANSDAFNFGPQIWVGTRSYFIYGLFGQLAESIKNFLNPALLLISVVLAFWAANSFALSRKAKDFFDSVGAPQILFVLGLIFFLAGMFPYVAVSRSVVLHGWGTRNAVLIAVPVAMMLVGAVWSLAPYVQSLSKRDWAKRLPMFLLSLLVVVFAVETIEFYLLWQLRAIKDNSVIVNFARQPEAVEGVSIFLVFDKFRVGGETKYRPHEYYGMFARAWPAEEKIGFDVNYYAFEQYFFTDEPMLQDTQLSLWYPRLDVYGCQSEMHINVGSIDLDPTIFLRYFYYRFLKPIELTNFLSTVTDLQFIPVDSELATNCAR